MGAPCQYLGDVRKHVSKNWDVHRIVNNSIALSTILCSPRTTTPTYQELEENAPRRPRCAKTNYHKNATQQTAKLRAMQMDRARNVTVESYRTGNVTVK